ncbi:MAG TPA: GNAT family N-acetyltransferase [Ktedonobacterales bacterium]
MTLNIRPLASADIAALGELSVLAWEPVFASFRHILGPAIYPLIYPDWQQQQREVVTEACSDSARYTVLVAEVDGSVVGFIAYEIDQATLTGEVYLLAVHPDYQNRGIGAALNVYVLEEMKARGMRLAVVGTGGDPGHAPARRTYEKAGYTGLPLVRYYKRL